ncbi:AAA family ATPase [Stieleria varia]|uniref:Denitrification regulatory protein NirQ n=1 Tax=Stieleria varia TaxID=2528005 RepID=A0A5C6ATF6_9BACT|nr:MoxR family ATPase [Stieleria varia]TWU02848.1 Denitrification regulatory protein NirQ [Stieleria varia]
MSLDTGVQCIACGRVKRVSQEHLGRRLKCNCGNIAVIEQQALISLPPKTSRPSVATPPPPRVGGEHAPLPDDQLAVIESLRDSFRNITTQLSTVIVGQQAVIEEVLISIFCRGHVLLTGVPGLAKTLLIDSISKVLDLDFRRIQFTPDLMPADITGTEVLQEDRTTGTRNFQFVEGPVFSNMVLADEINRAPPKTQAALLEAMQERHVTIAGQTMKLPSPFFVMATQNPIEQEGTYPLPEAQLDRFLFNCVVDYPESADEFRIIKQATSGHQPTLDKLLDAEQIQKLQEAVRNIPAADHVIAYARDLVQATRPNGGDAPGFIKEMIGWGAGPRAGIALIIAAKARAVLHGRLHATTGDVASVALPVLRHRIVTTFHAEAAGVQRDDVIRKLIEVIRPKPPKA